jgi:hypothetical protein
MQGKILSTLKDLEEFIQEDQKFDEFDQSMENFNGILVKIIEKVEMLQDPEIELEDNVNACQHCGGHIENFRTGCIDGCVNEEVPVIVKQPCYYDKPIPVPVYRKKIIPYEVIREEKVYIPKYEYVHIPVEVPIKVPFNVVVPCYKEVTKVCP